MATSNQWNELPLNSNILRIIEQEFQFKTMMPVQKSSIPLFLKNYDVAVEAQTGSGKTLCFLVPLFNQIISKFKGDQNQLFGMIITPSRELASQIFEVAGKFNSLNYKIHLCIGGTAIETEIETVNQGGCNILIGTPGKLRALLQSEQLELAIKTLEYLILDEADRLMSDEYADDLKQILSRLPKQRRTGLFSATLSSAKIQDLLKMGLRNPVQVKVDVNSQMPATLKNYYVVSANRPTKFGALIDIIKMKCQNNKTIIFFNTCSSVVYYHALFSRLVDLKDFQFQCLHGQMKQKKRNKIYNHFRAITTTSQILLTTDVLARGIDIEDLPLVIQFDPPQDPSFFIHRSGRTARKGKDGESILMIEEAEKGFLQYLIRNNINMEELQFDAETQFDEVHSKLMKILCEDRDIVEKGKSAFISFIRSYKEHKLKVLFQFSNLNIGKVAESFFLFRLPRIKEILGKKIDFQQSDINPSTIAFVDKNKEKQFLSKKEQKKDKLENKETEVLQKQQKQQNQQNQQKQNLNIKNKKSIRKKIKQQHEESEEEEMVIEQRLVKKLKSGKISLQQFKEQMRELDPDDLESLDYDERVI